MALCTAFNDIDEHEHESNHGTIKWGILCVNGGKIGPAVAEIETTQCLAFKVAPPVSMITSCTQNLFEITVLKCGITCVNVDKIGPAVAEIETTQGLVFKSGATSEHEHESH